MAEEELREPREGDSVLTIDGDGDPVELVIDKVGLFDEKTGCWEVSAESEDLKVYWSDGDGSWVDAEADFDEEGDD